MTKKTVFASFIFAILMVFNSMNLLAQDRSDTIHVAHYDIMLTVMDFTNQNIQGETQLTIVSKISNLNHVVLDLLALTTDSVKVNGTLATFQHQGERLSVTVPTMQAGDTVLVKVFYHGVPAKDSGWGGFYFSGQYAYSMGVAFNSIPHNFGRCWYPCLDVFPDKSTYRIRVRTEQNKMAVCDGMLTQVQTLSDSSKVWTWELDEPIPTYLSSVAVGEYQAYEDTFQGQEATIPIVIYAQPAQYSNVGASFHYLKDILRMYEELFGPYRWPRVGYVGVNFNAGAMEHATNIAYPKSFMDGSDTYVTLYGHELFHHWFGDLITCERAEEMWINEGFATFSEPLIMGLVHQNDGTDGYLDYLRDMHHSTLLDIVKNDGGHFALDNVPQDVTYGTHSYDKGALVIHTLKSYLGDSLFYSGLRSLLDHYAWQNVNSEQFFQYLSQVTGVDLTDFYEGWIHQPGFPQFGIDSIRHLSGNQYEVFVQQKLCGATNYINSNKLDLTFVSPDRELYTVSDVPFSGQYSSAVVTIPFTPVFGIIDYSEKIMDATIDYTKTVAGNSSLVALSDANCTFRVDVAQDSVLVRVEHNIVSPDIPASLPDSIYRMSETHYWNVQLAYPSNMPAPEGFLQFQFRKGATTALDYDLLQGYEAANVKLLYRPTTADSWQVIPAIRTGSPNAGMLKTYFIGSGQYCFAVGDEALSIDEYQESYNVMIYPNPVVETMNVWFEYDGRPLKASIVDSAGRTLRSFKLKGGGQTINVVNLPTGTYFLRIGQQTYPFIKY
ncbi:MAG: T9SS type A sorting domain-containing protein [Bacteroidales bacterium]|nr:T9SS type A sorting domain-containing protein [Bacteroidales bacterium]